MRQRSAHWGNRRGHRTVCDLSTAIWSGVNSCVHKLQILMATTVELPLRMKKKVLRNAVLLCRSVETLTKTFGSRICCLFATFLHNWRSESIRTIRRFILFYLFYIVTHNTPTPRLLSVFHIPHERHFTSETSILKSTWQVLDVCVGLKGFCVSESQLVGTIRHFGCDNAHLKPINLKQENKS